MRGNWTLMGAVVGYLVWVSFALQSSEQGTLLDNWAFWFGAGFLVSGIISAVIFMVAMKLVKRKIEKEGG